MAWHGAIGKAVLGIAPYTEADPVAILAQALAMFGALVGISPHTTVGGVVHRARIWPLLIGPSAWGRKGTSLHDAKWLTRRMSGYASKFLASRKLLGLSTAEGLLTALGAGPPPKEPDAEALAPDGALYVEETEFERVLNMAKRDGNTLTQLLRQLWEDDSAGTATRANPLRVDRAHITVIGHITAEGLKAKLSESELAGGTANRFLLIGCDHTQLLSRELERPDLAELLRTLGEAAEQARAVRLVRRDRRAGDLWDEVYHALADDKPTGSLGNVLARGPAYVNRLALVYALADGASMIAPDHLLAGLSLWHYATQSARGVFEDGRSRGDVDRLADFIAAAQGGRTRKEIFTDLFRGNRTRTAIDEMVDHLMARGDLIEQTDRDTGGRPAIRLLWTGAHRDAVAELLERYRHGYTP
ncbi:MAG: hypothetical protein AUG44_03380 [Actinobacteria bacterium 13_1_20CM_3_71_11]|nr:MAG: hypothetical protein AUG44_03380 [Actinobacteria bacterium 13_1_20CM_3_71_11]